VDPLLERGDELAALESVVEAARDGRGQLVLVAGEAGIGKTSLVRALRERLGEGAAAFLVGVCEPLSVPVPLAPLRELVGAAARAFARDRSRHGAAALRGPRRSSLANAAGLTRREQEVLEHVAADATNADIARALHLSHRTVEHHVSSILAKLGATTRAAAVDAARTAGALSGETT
jgi:DNA-binding CsgD family transcriptional regulator